MEAGGKDAVSRGSHDPSTSFFVLILAKDGLEQRRCKAEKKAVGLSGITGWLSLPILFLHPSNTLMPTGMVLL